MKVDDWVICVDAAPAPNGTPVPLIKGEAYQIERVHGDLPHGDGEVGLGAMWMDLGLDLYGVPDPMPGLCYGAHRFRPIEPVAAPERVLEAAS